MSKSTAQSKQSARAKAEKVAADGKEVRDRIAAIMVDLVEQGKVDLAGMQDTAAEMMHGAVEGVNRKLPAKPQSVLRQVISGLADGLGTAAGATAMTANEAASHGKDFTKKEWNQVISTLKSMEEQFVGMVSKTARDVGGQVKMQSGEMADHARTAFRDVKPSIESAIRSLAGDPLGFAGETVKAGVEASRQAVGLAAQTVSGILQGTGSVLGKLGDKASGTSPKKKPTTTARSTVGPKKKASKKKAARKKREG
ncbi:MAG: hypothetical protein JJU36_11800 [Phycisphaeraceae bacterium]|nr:hypothetical protein [Phycisphaeraceae bacterium]